MKVIKSSIDAIPLITDFNVIEGVATKEYNGAIVSFKVNQTAKESVLKNLDNRFAIIYKDSKRQEFSFVLFEHFKTLIDCYQK